MLVFISGKLTNGYTATKKQMEANLRMAEYIAKTLWEEGFLVFCPHLNTNFEDNLKIDYEQYMKFDLKILGICDVIYAIPGWTDSKGSLREIDEAKKLNIPIAFSLEDLRKIKKRFYHKEALKVLDGYDKIYAEGRQELVKNHIK